MFTKGFKYGMGYTIGSVFGLVIGCYALGGIINHYKKTDNESDLDKDTE